MRVADPANARIELRAKRADKQLLDAAAKLTGKTSSAFALEAILERARAEVERSKTILLKERDAELFHMALTSPPVPNEALRRLFAKTNS